jgi:hypothetical protein
VFFSWFVSPLHTFNSMENNTSLTKISARKRTCYTQK